MGSSKVQPENARGPRKPEIPRRRFVQWCPLVMGWAALPQHLTPLSFAPDAGQDAAGPGANSKATLLPDGAFHNRARGWQLGAGCQIETASNAPTPEVLHVKSRGSSTARAIIVSPYPGRTYTVRGFMRTNEVEPVEPGGCALMALAQYEFAGRSAASTAATIDPVVESAFAKLSGTHEWTPFSHTFRCLPLVVWFELSLGLHRSAGEAWFAGITIVEGPDVAEIAAVTPLEEEKGFPAPKRSSRGAVAIWRDRVPVEGIASDPEFIAATLRGAGYQVDFLTSDQLAEPNQLTRERYDVLALPYGASFPGAAQQTLRAFLARGGSFFSTGGYAFNNPLVKAANGWITEKEAVASEPGTETVREGDFESSLEACLAAGWRISNPQTCSLDPTQAHAGRQSARISAGDQYGSTTSTWQFETAVDHENQRFEFSCWAKSEASARYDGYAFILLEQLTNSGGSIGTARIEVARLRGSSGWTQYRHECVACSGVSRLRLTFGLRATGSFWIDEVSLRRKSDEVRINTARGNTYDELRVTPEQIGVFDADYRLRRVSSLSTAPDQDVVRAPHRIQASVTGYAASGVLGAGNSRWIPLVNSYDGYGRLRGAAGALMRHYNGVYRKSHWAFFGVEDRDLFSKNDPGAGSLLLDVFDALTRKTFLHEARTNFASYRQGEDVRILSCASNFSSQARKLSIKYLVLEADSGREQFSTAQNLELAPDQSALVEATWPGGKFDKRRYTVRIELFEAGKRIDHVETGFLVWDEQVLAGGFPLKFLDNYFRWNERATFLQGSDDYIHTFINLHENPKTWYEDLAKYKDHFLLVYENLMGARGLDDVPPEAWWREIDAVMQICQELKIIFFPGLMIFGNTAVGDRDLAHQQEFCKAFAKRYGVSSGLMYYLNGDVVLRNPDIPDLRAIFNDYLRQKYGSDQRLSEAWRVSPPEAKIGGIAPRPGTAAWDDVRTYDYAHFRVNVVRRWLDALAEAVRQADSVHPVTAEFSQVPQGGNDVVLAIGSLTAGNVGYFGNKGDDVFQFPQQFRYIDLRARGKTVNAGEFGVKTHPAWAERYWYGGTRSEQEENQLFLAIPHYAVGLGGSKVQNWCWKYPADFPFEWGINYPCDLVSRDALLYYRNTGLFFKQFDLRYDAPEIFVLEADRNRLGGQGEAVRQGQLNSIRYLLNLHCEFGSIDEFYLESLPSACKTLFYPLPFCPDDEAFERVCEFVRSGGTLYLSGDISYDPDRVRSRAARLGKLLGVEFQSENYPNIRFEGHKTGIRPLGKFSGLTEYDGYPCIRVKPTTAETVAHATDDSPVIFTNKLGRGRVFYSTDVLELHAPARTTAYGQMIYSGFLNWAGAARLGIEPDNPWIHVFRSRTRQDDELYTIVNRDESAPKREITLQTRTGPAQVEVAQAMTGAVAVNASGAIQSIETSGGFTSKGAAYCDSASHIMLLSLDNKDLKSSEMLCLLPMGEGKVRLKNDFIAGSARFQVGEFRRSRWVPMEQGQVPIRNGWIEMEINRDRNLTIILIGSAGRIDEGARRLSGLLSFSA